MVCAVSRTGQVPYVLANKQQKASSTLLDNIIFAKIFSCFVNQFCNVNKLKYTNFKYSNKFSKHDKNM